jgi:hypothetical protein
MRDVRRALELCNVCNAILFNTINRCCWTGLYMYIYGYIHVPAKRMRVEGVVSIYIYTPAKGFKMLYLELCHLHLHSSHTLDGAVARACDIRSA